MNNETKKLVGTMFGHIFRLQKAVGVPTFDDATIFGLLNGIEPAIDKVIGDNQYITTDMVDAAARVLQPYFDDDAKLAGLKGFYDIERALQSEGIDRIAAIYIFRYFQASGSYQSVLAKMDTSDSPGECRTFELRSDEF